MNFAFLSCPATLQQLRLSRPALRLVPGGFLSGLNRFLPFKVKAPLEVEGISGILLEYPGLPDHLTDILPKLAEKKAAQVSRLLENHNTRVLGVEDSLLPLTPAICARWPVLIPAGISMTIVAVLAIILELISQKNEARALIVNPLTPPGTVFAHLLAPRLRSLVLAGKLRPGLERLRQKILRETGTASIISPWRPELLAGADILIDLAGMNLSALSSTAFIWQPMGGQPTQGADVLGQPLIHFPGLPAVHGDLPVGVLRPPMAETIIVARGERRLAAGNYAEITAVGVLAAQARSRADMLRVVGNSHNGSHKWFPAPIEI